MNRHIFQNLLLLLLFISCLQSCYYDNALPIPEAKLVVNENLSWTDQDVDAVVQRSHETIFSPVASDFTNIPQACQHINFLRYHVQGASNNSQDADAVVMMMPGIIEGANAFHYFARQLIYIAKTQRQLDLEVWAVERRANCLEDLRGFNASEAIADTQLAQDTMINYYYHNQAIDGETFAGFLTPEETPFLADFGMALATTDMFTIMKTRMPNLEQRQKKLFVGGHSLGGIHTSLFLSWDEDSNILTTSDAGYNNVAGVYALDAPIGDFSQAPYALLDFLPFPELFVSLLANFTETAYVQAIEGLKQGIGTYLQVPGFFTPEVMSLLEGLGMLADREPDQEFTALDDIPQSEALTNLLNFFQAQDSRYVIAGPFYKDFRYTNEAALNLIFDSDFSSLNLLHTSLGFMHGGSIAEKDHLLAFFGAIDILDPIFSAIVPEGDLFTAADAGPDFSNFGSGPLYGWASYNEVANNQDTVYTDISGEYIFTSKEKEMVNGKDFYPSLFIGDSNLTEWYFPQRIIFDLFAIIHQFGQTYGLNTLHSDRIVTVPSIIFKAGDGTGGFSTVIIPNVSGEVVTIPNMGHLDPMFAVANNPEHYENPILPKFLDFIEQHRQTD